MLSSNTADIHLLSLSVVDKDEIINKVINDENAKSEEKKNSKKTEFKIGVILETILSSSPIMLVAYLITKMFFDVKTVLLILFCIFIFIFLLVFTTHYLYEKILKKHKNSNSGNQNNTYMLNEGYIWKIVFDTKRYRNVL